MDFINELKWRDMFFDATPGIEEELADKTCTGYIGFDPTAPSLTLGNYVQIMILSLFQRAGHRPIILMGGATGRIGDPSGKDKERDLISLETLNKNLEAQAAFFPKFLDFNPGPNQAIIVNNMDFYYNMNVLTFLRDVGKSLTVNYMMSKESVKNRVETGMSFTEFSYQLLQAYDFQCLFQNYNCTFQMGGSDQWGNITSGTELVRRNLGGKAFAVTTPLLTKPDGTKYGKSTEGNIWIDPDRTSPYEFYQFLINADDAMTPKLIRYFTLKSREEVESLEAQYAEDPRKLKEILAEELTRRIHSDKDYEAVLQVSKLLFDPKANKESLLEMDADALKMVAREVSSFEVPKNLIASGLNIIDLLADHTEIVSSKGDARRAIKGNAVSVNKDKISDFDQVVNVEHLIHGKYIMVENGKRNKYMIIAN